MNQAGWSQTLHASWTGIVLTIVGLVLFVALGLTVFVLNGLGFVSAALLIAAVAVTVVVLRDMPIAATFTASGVARRTPLRRHHIAWADITRLDRVRSGVMRTRSANKAGGLAARVGNRRLPLTDRMESAVEFDLLRDRIGHERADALGLVAAIRPVDGRSPTWQYRRRRWHPS